MDPIEQPPSSDGTPSEVARTDEDVQADEDVVPGDQPAAIDATEPDFLSELAVAMRGVAGQERDRLSTRAAEDGRVHIEDARARGATEEASLRGGATDDLAGIDAWADAEIQRVRGEAAARSQTRRSELEAALVRHETVIDDEVRAVEAAVAEYDASLAAFMDELGTVTDPSEIARRATLMPARKDLDRVRADARAAALARVAPETSAEGHADEASDASADAPASPEAPTPIGVMDPTAYGDEADATGHRPWDESEPAPEASEDPITPASSGGSSTAVRLLRTVPRWSPSTPDQGSDEAG